VSKDPLTETVWRTPTGEAVSGTAEICDCSYYDAWFIFFAPAENPVVAGAVLVEHQLNGFGGAVSAPIAKAIMQAILPAASNGKP